MKVLNKIKFICFGIIGIISTVIAGEEKLHYDKQLNENSSLSQSYYYPMECKNYVKYNKNSDYVL